MKLSDQPGWMLALQHWKHSGSGLTADWRRLPALPRPLPFAEFEAEKLDGELQQLLNLIPQPSKPTLAASPPAQPSTVDQLPIGVFLRGISFSGKPLAANVVAQVEPSCRHFFRYQVNWHGSDRSVDLVQLAAWATAEAIERSRKAAPPREPSVREFFPQIAWSGVTLS